MNSIKKRFCNPIVALCVLYGAGSAHADAVTDWNAIMEATVAAPPTNPFFQAPSGAIVQLAVFEAVNTVVGNYEPYLGTIAAPPGASPDAAAIAAAYRTLVTLRPGSAPALDAARAQSLSAIPDGPAKDAGIAVGEAAAAAMLLLRANDGWNAVVPYTPGTDPGDWQPTLPLNAPALLPGWGLVTPFGLEEGSQFRAPPPPALHTGKYANDYNEVQLVGRIDSPFRPQDRTDVAHFYAAATPIQTFNPAARRSAPRTARRSRRTRGSSPCWRWRWRTARLRCSTPSTSTIAGGPSQRSGTQTSTTITGPTRIRPGSR